MCILIYLVLSLITRVVDSSGQYSPEVTLRVSQNEVLDDGCASSQQETETLDFNNEVNKSEYSFQELEVISKEGPTKIVTSSPKNRISTSLKKDLSVWTPKKNSIKNYTTIIKDHGIKISKHHKKRSFVEKNKQSESTLTDYKFSVSIQRKGTHYVSGALIGKRWILSVAGEFYNVRESIKLLRARLGSLDCKKGGIVIPIKSIEIHPYYVHGKPNFDIALLRMASSVDFTNAIKPIGISNIKGKIISAKFMTTYWPRVMVNGQLMPRTAKERIKFNSMRVSTQSLIPIDVCAKIMRGLAEIMNESSLCLKPIKAHHSSCMPDAGAPVVAEDGLWGITSGWIIPSCPNKTAPTIFTRLSSASVRSWLDSQFLNN